MLEGQLGQVVDSRSEGDDGHARRQGEHPDGAVHRHEAAGVGEQGRELSPWHVEDALTDSMRGGQIAAQGGPVAQTIV